MRKSWLQWVLPALSALQLAVVGAVVYRATAAVNPNPSPPETQSPQDTAALTPEEGRITEANFWRIDKKMSRADVEAILGPPGDYSTGPLYWGPKTSRVLSTIGPHPTGAYKAPYRKDFFGDGVVDVVEWRTDGVMIVVYFHPSAHLRKACYDVVPAAR